ncbi:MAG: replication-associated recombination protein A [Ruminococcaceae bacterium]|nr:replication-associated recombination protein A [Oscillospiraceae bacterium]
MNYQKRPLAEMMRPESFDDMVGQEHLFGKNGVIRKMTAGGYLPNMIFFGPPGTGKTTAASILAASSDMTIHKLNATTASLADVKDVCAQTSSVFATNGILLYLDEIQYFNKKQQQSLLEYIEDGRITLIASTTENPYMYVYNAIISRSAVFEFKSVKAKDIVPALRKATEKLCKEYETDKTVSDETLEAIASAAAGDVRRSLNLLENCFFASENEITLDILSSVNSTTVGNFDKDGTVHYDLLSALQKSIRGSDPDATAFYLARLLDGGDLLGACRRLQVIASEDIGLAYPIAATVTDSCVNSALRLGLPEAAIPLSHAALLLATAPKSNSAHIAYEAALADVRAGKGRNFPKILRQVNNFDGYKYPHDYPNHYVNQKYLPDDLKGVKYFEYGTSKNEIAAKDYWNNIKNKNGDN